MATTDVEISFVDTNILLAASDGDRLCHAEATELLQRAFSGQERLFACGQVFREYLVVATRPIENNGLGLRPKKATENIQSFRQCLQILDENDPSTQRLESLVIKHRLKGKRIHDANIVSIMIENGLRRIFTVNPNDFKAFPEILALKP